MDNEAKLRLLMLFVIMAAYVYFVYRMDKRNERMDKEIFRGMNITPPKFSEGKIDETD